MTDGVPSHGELTPYSLKMDCTEIDNTNPSQDLPQVMNTTDNVITAHVDTDHYFSQVVMSSRQVDHNYFTNTETGQREAATQTSSPKVGRSIARKLVGRVTSAKSRLPFPCVLCSDGRTRFRSLSLLLTHYMSFHKISPAGIKPSSSRGSINSRLSSLFHRKYSKELVDSKLIGLVFKKELKSNSLAQIILLCSECDKRFSTTDSLLKHRYVEHGNGRQTMVTVWGETSGGVNTFDSTGDVQGGTAFDGRLTVPGSFSRLASVGITQTEMTVAYRPRHPMINPLMNGSFPSTPISVSPTEKKGPRYPPSKSQSNLRSLIPHPLVGLEKRSANVSSDAIQPVKNSIGVTVSQPTEPRFVAQSLTRPTATHSGRTINCQQYPQTTGPSRSTSSLLRNMVRGPIPVAPSLTSIIMPATGTINSYFKNTRNNSLSRVEATAAMSGMRNHVTKNATSVPKLVTLLVPVPMPEDEKHVTTLIRPTVGESPRKQMILSNCGGNDTLHPTPIPARIKTERQEIVERVPEPVLNNDNLPDNSDKFEPVISIKREMIDSPSDVSAIDIDQQMDIGTEIGGETIGEKKAKVVERIDDTRVDSVLGSRRLTDGDEFATSTCTNACNQTLSHADFTKPSISQHPTEIVQSSGVRETITDGPVQYDCDKCSANFESIRKYPKRDLGCGTVADSDKLMVAEVRLYRVKMESETADVTGKNICTVDQETRTGKDGYFDEKLASLPTQDKMTGPENEYPTNPQPDVVVGKQCMNELLKNREISGKLEENRSILKPKPDDEKFCVDSSSKSKLSLSAEESREEQTDQNSSIQQHDAVPLGKFICRYCSAPFTMFGDFVDHLHTEHNDKVKFSKKRGSVKKPLRPTGRSHESPPKRRRQSQFSDKARKEVTIKKYLTISLQKLKLDEIDTKVIHKKKKGKNKS